MYERDTAREFSVDLDKALRVSVGHDGPELEPGRFTTSDGRGGWTVRIPGARPIATPAWSDGLLFVGGGYGSYEFYAFDALTGGLAWKIRTDDDGPTAAVVEDDLVAFNTESCTVFVVEARTGNVVWKEWLGDPLMSQPAISDGRLYIAYPKQGRGHQILCTELRTGKHIWEQPITADVITAPVVHEGHLYFTCHDGTSFCFDADRGREVWKDFDAATSAPVFSGGRMYRTSKSESARGVVEELHAEESPTEASRRKASLRRKRSPYLRRDSGGGVGMDASTTQSLDAEVGFGGGAPQAAALDKANAHLGVHTVAGGWAYQGSRGAAVGGRVLNAQGNEVNCVVAGTKQGGGGWKARATGDGIDEESQLFVPPSAGKRRAYLASRFGHLLSVEPEDGQVTFAYHLGEPVVFQPALAGGNAYLGTANGLLVCLETGDEDADGWYAWGGNAQHSKAERAEQQEAPRRR